METLVKPKIPTKWKEAHYYFDLTLWKALTLEEKEELLAEDVANFRDNHSKVLFAIGYCDHPHGHKHYYPKLGDAKPTLEQALAKFPASDNFTVNEVHVIIFGIGMLEAA